MKAWVGRLEERFDRSEGESVAARPGELGLGVAASAAPRRDVGCEARRPRRPARRPRCLGLAAGFAALLGAAPAVAATLTYSAIVETLRTHTIAVGSQGGGVTHADGDTQHLLSYTGALESQSLDFDTQTGALALSGANAHQTTLLTPIAFTSSTQNEAGTQTVQGGQGLAESTSILEFAFAADVDTGFTIDVSADCAAVLGCEVLVEVFGPLGVGTLLTASTQGGAQSGTVTATLIGGATYFLTARSIARSSSTGSAADSALASWDITLGLNPSGGLPEPPVALLLGPAAVGGLAARWARRLRGD